MVEEGSSQDSETTHQIIRSDNFQDKKAKGYYCNCDNRCTSRLSIQVIQRKDREDELPLLSLRPRSYGDGDEYKTLSGATVVRVGCFVLCDVTWRSERICRQVSGLCLADAGCDDFAANGLPGEKIWPGRTHSPRKKPQPPAQLN